MKSERVGRYVLPDLATPRVDFDRAVNQRIPWPEDGRTRSRRRPIRLREKTMSSNREESIE